MSIDPKPNGPILSADEEVTLRRVAFGQSLVRAMRAQDLAQLRKLRLIEESKDGPQLTAAGKKAFEALPRPMTLSESGKSSDDLLGAMNKMSSAPAASSDGSRQAKAPPPLRVRGSRVVPSTSAAGTSAVGRGEGRSIGDQPMVFRLSADILPLRRSDTSSNSTFWPSARLERPARSTALIWTKASLPPSSG